jgi:hypothetical protein
MNQQDLERMAEIVGSAIKKSHEAPNEKIAALERRLAVLEARPELKYVGTYSDREHYAVGNLVTSSGSLWYCHIACEGIRPGTSNHFQLVAKRGRDAT